MATPKKKVAESETPKKRGPGRPKGSRNEASKRTKGPCNLSLDLDVIDWLDSMQPERSAVANRLLRAAKESGLTTEAIEKKLLRKKPLQ